MGIFSLDSILKAFSVKSSPQHPFQSVTSTTEEMLRHLGYNPRLLKRHKFKTKGVRVLNVTSSLTQEQKQRILNCARPAVSSRSFMNGSEEGARRFHNDLFRMLQKQFAPCLYHEQNLVLMYGEDMPFYEILAVNTGLPAAYIEQPDTEAGKQAWMAFIFLHELGHFEKRYHRFSHSWEMLEAEIYCDRRSLSALYSEAASVQNGVCREVILARAVRDIITKVSQYIYPSHSYDTSGQVSYSYYPRTSNLDISHATALFLSKPHYETELRRLPREYKGLLTAFCGIFQEMEARPGIDAALIYKAARTLLVRDNKGVTSLSDMQRDILELYAEGMEYFCPTKCASWQAELEAGAACSSVASSGPDISL
ncbi:MAG: hypothetical protein LRY51_08485 [Geovibrio sp.]|nr:hypothetical protein [Geovibrio sp.]